MTVDGRLTLPGLGVSLVPLDVWSLTPLPPGLPGLGVYLRHAGSGVQLNVRVLLAQPALPADDFEAASTQYLDSNWFGPRRISTFATGGGLRGATGAYDEAMPGAIVREWLVSDGRRFVNAATYATARQWEDGLLDDCEALLRSIRIE
jgi:hypothetical protein